MDDHIDEYIVDILRDNNFYEIEEGIYEYMPETKPDEMTLREYFSKSEEEQQDIKERYRLYKPLSFKEALKKLEEHGFKYSQELTDFSKEC
jgi:parvulin-like peptidyl-prolyl isomerase